MTKEKIINLTKEIEKAKKEIINFDDYLNGYCNTLYEVYIGYTGTFYVIAGDEQEAIDLIADYLEGQGNEGCFISNEEIDRGEIYEDEYIVAGNHCRNLYHGGHLYIPEIINLREMR